MLVLTSLNQRKAEKLKYEKLIRMTNYITFLCLAIFCCLNSNAQIQIIFRGDDMGFSHSSNIAHIDAYQNGVIRTVEVIVPGPWFEEAAELISKHPDLDVGVHLVLTSEWRWIKWRPLTKAPSLVDEDGYFYPTIWPVENKQGASLLEQQWDLNEIEQEFRAQIELAMKRIPQVTHFTGHMGCTHMSEEVMDLARKLAEEYDLDIVPADHGFVRLPSWGGKEFNFEQKMQRLTKVLKELSPGKYLSVTHPVYLNEETRNINHVGYENVGQDRDAETQVLTSKELTDLIESMDIEIVGYHQIK